MMKNGVYSAKKLKFYTYYNFLSKIVKNIKVQQKLVLLVLRVQQRHMLLVLRVQQKHMLLVFRIQQTAYFEKM